MGLINTIWLFEFVWLCVDEKMESNFWRFFVLVVFFFLGELKKKNDENYSLHKIGKIGRWGWWVGRDVQVTTIAGEHVIH